jgi:hypothetical protein
MSRVKYLSELERGIRSDLIALTVGLCGTWLVGCATLIACWQSA